MNGYGLAAVVVASVAAVVVAVLWAVVRVSQRPAAPDAGGGGELRRQVAEAAERSRRGREGE